MEASGHAFRLQPDVIDQLTTEMMQVGPIRLSTYVIGRRHQISCINMREPKFAGGSKPKLFIEHQPGLCKAKSTDRIKKHSFGLHLCADFSVSTIESPFEIQTDSLELL